MEETLQLTPTQCSSEGKMPYEVLREKLLTT